MRDDQLLKRLPFHKPDIDVQTFRVLGSRKALGVITNGEEGINLYPRPETK